MPKTGFDYPNPVNRGPLRNATAILKAGDYENAEKMRESDANEIILRNITQYSPVMTANEIDFYGGIVDDREALKHREATRKCQLLHLQPQD